LLANSFPEAVQDQVGGKFLDARIVRGNGTLGFHGARGLHDSGHGGDFFSSSPI